MRTRNCCLSVLLLVLAVSTLAAITAPVAKAYMRPPVQVVIIDRGDPDGFPLNAASQGGNALSLPQSATAKPPGAIPPVRPVLSPTVLRIAGLDLRELCHILFLHVLVRR